MILHFKKENMWMLFLLLQMSNPDHCVLLFSAESQAWHKGVTYAEGQNLARYLMEAPANYITPIKFAEHIEQKLRTFSNVKVHIR